MSLEKHHKFILDTMDRQNAIARKFVAELESENARLKAEVERLTKAGDALVYSLQWCDWGSHIQTIDGVNRWNAAKEGKQS